MKSIKQKKKGLIYVEIDREMHRMSAKMHEAAELIAHGRLSYNDVAKQVGVSLTSLKRWVISPKFETFQQLVRDFQQRYAEQIYQRGLARREIRIESLVEMHDRMMMIVRERAERMKGQVAGGASGLLGHDRKSIGIDVVDVYKFDAALVEKLIEVQREIAEELGQRVERKEIAGTMDVSIINALHEGRRRVAEWHARQVAAGKLPAQPQLVEAPTVAEEVS